MNAYIVVDLGFGDSGKGLLTDFLVRHTGATLVVRYNGGAQAGHNVVTAEGVHHTFAQFGAGTFVPGVQTLLSRHVVIHPTALLVEAKSLEQKGVPNPLERIRISDQARVITPFHQAANRIRELARGDNRHGSCGIGVGEAVQDSLAHPEDCILAGDLGNVTVLRAKLNRIRERKRDELSALADQLTHNRDLQRELAIFEVDSIAIEWILAASSLTARGLILPDVTLGAQVAQAGAVVFEGAQGVLLDEWQGFHPFTTWSTCTANNAIELLSEWASEARAERIGVLRTYLTRHGPGPLPTETESLRDGAYDHNRTNPWQGPVRYGWFDAVLARYALDVVGGVDRLAITHCDAVSRLSKWQACRGYRLDSPLPDAELVAEATVEGFAARLKTAAEHSLDHSARLTGMLARTTPIYDQCAADENRVLEQIESLLGRHVDLVSHGPRAQDVSFTGRGSRTG